jgi:hypothetical protein
MNEQLYHGIPKEEAIAQGCTCYHTPDDDKFVTSICPLYTKEESFSDIKKVLLTDSHLIDYVRFEGFIFNCPKCGLNSVLVNGNVPGLCLNTKCLTTFKVRSTTVHNHVRQQEKQLIGK